MPTYLVAWTVTEYASTANVAPGLPGFSPKEVIHLQHVAISYTLYVISFDDKKTYSKIETKCRKNINFMINYNNNNYIFCLPLFTVL